MATPSGLYLIEIKSLYGALRASGSHWIQYGPTQETRTFDNPLHLADQKAKELRSLLSRAAAKHRVKVPFIQDRVLVALEAGDDESPETPAAQDILVYVIELGVVADRLASEEVLPTPPTVLRDLRAVPAP